jgi:hypothetical protein
VRVLRNRMHHRDTPKRAEDVGEERGKVY